jgi:hypothetical protein
MRVFSEHQAHARCSPLLLLPCGAGGPRVPNRGLLNPCSALAASFQWFDRWWADARCDPSLTEHGWDDSGSTAVVGLVSGQHLIVANAGAALPNSWLAGS